MQGIELRKKFAGFDFNLRLVNKYISFHTHELTRLTKGSYTWSIFEEKLQLNLQEKVLNGPLNEGNQHLVCYNVV